jgi:hypothetical protein
LFKNGFRKSPYFVLFELEQKFRSRANAFEL